jgi:RimJ/RimL family protein N-acetyltransferase
VTEEHPRAVELEGRFVRLEPLAPAHDQGIALAAADPRIWRHTAFGPDAAAYLAAARAAQKSGEQIPFVVRLLDGDRIVGMTRLFEIDAQHRRCEIGYTWYVPDVWGTAVNPEAKLLLLTHCFDSWGARRVQFKTDHENLRSQAAIERLGAVQEGVLRAHMIRPDGSRRDSALYSITREEWPKVKAGLEARLTAR